MHYFRRNLLLLVLLLSCGQQLFGMEGKRQRKCSGDIPDDAMTLILGFVPQDSRLFFRRFSKRWNLLVLAYHASCDDTHQPLRVNDEAFIPVGFVDFVKNNRFKKLEIALLECETFRDTYMSGHKALLPLLYKRLSKFTELQSLSLVHSSDVDEGWDISDLGKNLSKLQDLKSLFIVDVDLYCVGNEDYKTFFNGVATLKQLKSLKVHCFMLDETPRGSPFVSGSDSALKSNFQFFCRAILQLPALRSLLIPQWSDTSNAIFNYYLPWFSKLKKLQSLELDDYYYCYEGCGFGLFCKWLSGLEELQSFKGHFFAPDNRSDFGDDYCGPFLKVLSGLKKLRSLDLELSEMCGNTKNLLGLFARDLPGLKALQSLSLSVQSSHSTSAGVERFFAYLQADKQKLRALNLSCGNRVMTKDNFALLLKVISGSAELRSVRVSLGKMTKDDFSLLAEAISESPKLRMLSIHLSDRRDDTRDHYKQIIEDMNLPSPSGHLFELRIDFDRDIEDLGLVWG